MRPLGPLRRLKEWLPTVAAKTTPAVAQADDAESEAAVRAAFRSSCPHLSTRTRRYRPPAARRALPRVRCLLHCERNAEITDCTGEAAAAADDSDDDDDDDDGSRKKKPKRRAAKTKDKEKEKGKAAEEKKVRASASASATVGSVKNASRLMHDGRSLGQGWREAGGRRLEPGEGA
jgi:hypothetical protein